MATHSSTLAWKIPWKEEPGRLQSMGSLSWAQLSNFTFTFMHWRRKWQPTPVSYLQNPRDRGAWWAAVYGVTQSWTRLKRLSSSSPLSQFRCRHKQAQQKISPYFHVPFFKSEEVSPADFPSSHHSQNCFTNPYHMPA